METTNEIGSLYKNVSAFTAPFSLHSCNQTKVQSSNEITKIELLPSVNMQEWYCNIYGSGLIHGTLILYYADMFAVRKNND